MGGKKSEKKKGKKRIKRNGIRVKRANRNTGRRVEKE